MKDYAFDIHDAMSAPILTFSQSWRDIIPKRSLEIIPMARMIALMKQEELATYAEVAAYLYTRTHEAPMDYEWTDIYTHVCCTVCEEFFHEDHWDAVRAPRELSEWLQRQLDDLRRHLYKKRRELLKKEIRHEQKNRVIESCTARIQ